MDEQLPVAGYYRVSLARDNMHSPELYEDEITRYCTYRKLELARIFRTRLPESEEAPPHFVEGMQQLVTVTEGEVTDLPEAKPLRHAMHLDVSIAAGGLGPDRDELLDGDFLGPGSIGRPVGLLGLGWCGGAPSIIDRAWVSRGFFKASRQNRCARRSLPFRAPGRRSCSTAPPEGRY